MKPKILIFLAAIPLLNSCINLDDPMAPSWETKLNIPIKDTLYFLENQIKTDQYIGIDSSNNSLLYKVSSDVYQRRFSVNEYVQGQIDGVYTGYAVPFANGEAAVGIPFSSGAEIDSAHIKSGTMQIELINSTSNSAEEVTVTAVGLLDENGKPLSITTNIVANDNQSFNEDLSNYTYTSRNQVNPNELALDVSLSTQNPSDEELELRITINNSNFYYIDGILPQTEIKSIKETIELPITEDAEDFRNKVTFKHAFMEISAIYESDKTPLFPAEFKNLRMFGETLEGEQVQLTKTDGSKIDDQLIENGNFYKQYTTKEHNLSELFSLVPDSISLFADIIMNPESAQNRRGIATDTDSILVEFYIEAKAELELDTISISSEETLDLGDEDLDDIKNAKLRYTLQSELPAKLEIEFIFKDENKATLLTKTADFNSAGVTSEDYTIEPININDVLIFDDAEILLIDEAEYVELNIDIFTDQEAFSAWFGPQLSLDILSWLEVDYFVDNNEEN
jgi:hypothetical protein